MTHHVSAVEVLVDNIRDLDRDKEFAERVNAPAVSKLTTAQLDVNLVTEAINMPRSSVQRTSAVCTSLCTPITLRSSSATTSVPVAASS